MKGFITNIALALIWFILSQKSTVSSFVLGYLIGFGLVAFFSKVFGGKKYVSCVVGICYFLVLFGVQFIKANLEVARLVLFVPLDKFSSGFFDYSIDDMSYGEAILLAQCITLTPGTITTLFDWKNKRIRIHVLNYSNPSSIKEDIDQKLKQAIWKFTR